MTLMGIGRAHSRLTPPGPHWSLNKRFKYKKILLLKFIIVENCGVKAFGDFHFYSRLVLHIVFFFVSYVYIFVKCIIQSVFIINRHSPDSKNYLALII